MAKKETLPPYYSVKRKKDGKLIYPGDLGRLRKHGSHDAVEDEVALLESLVDFYGIDHGISHLWFRVAYSLAMEHVPGFRFEKRSSGRPPGTKKWTLKKQRWLVFHVEAAREMYPHFSIKNACRHLIKKGLYEDVTKESLPKLYAEAKKAVGENKITILDLIKLPE